MMLMLMLNFKATTKAKQFKAKSKTGRKCPQAKHTQKWRIAVAATAATTATVAAATVAAATATASRANCELCARIARTAFSAILPLLFDFHFYLFLFWLPVPPLSLPPSLSAVALLSLSCSRSLDELYFMPQITLRLTFKLK